MIQLNLLPEVKLKYIKSRRQKRLVIFVSSLTSLGALALVVLMLAYVFLVQGAQLTLTNKNIKKHSDSIANKRSQVDDINKVLTVQNQLGSLDELHADKPITSRLFDYIARVTPASIFISKLTLGGGTGATIDDNQDFIIQGSADTLESVNQFVDTLKFTTFKPSGQNAKSEPVFTDVVLTRFTRDRVGASYTINMKYNPIIFASENDVAGFVVPKGLITTRSELGRPILQTGSDPVIEETE